ncbi:CCA tRNA nucleotidyltransferase [Chloracidobacterium validum]|uniref:CCA tRNA nucleotidyltransferase n=1 Tax=Chloracidobacterium validum TaxID=2821543 RepID=A0ABX8B9Z7_9BACT|nr:CCA tRNA nucleotidyltransferase [Chloracidobacterium validum]QUW03499.1 CCA tRNA nucleotidyltransferase [Chloracidobacterium validum]
MVQSIPEWLIAVCKTIESSGGKGFLVGGCVRDRLLNYPVKDYDIEVYGLPSGQLRELLERHGSVNTVGEHFAVYKLRPKANASIEIDVSLPRHESKLRPGHRGFLIEGNPWMPFHEAASRRDFTINAILQDPFTQTILDPFRGVEDLANKRLQAVNHSTFRDDSLRVLRAAQLASRYQLSISPETIAMCQQTSLGDIPKERVRKEIEKLLLLSPKPSIGLDYCLKLGIISQVLPMLWDLHSSMISENPYTKEAFWDYTLISIDRGKKNTKELSEPEKLSVLLSILGLGLSTTRLIDLLDSLGIYTYKGHNIRNQVLVIISTHLPAYKIFYQSKKQNFEFSYLKRLARIIDIKLLICFLKSIFHTPESEYLSWAEEKVKMFSLLQNPFQDLLKGRHILEVGIPPGPHIKSIINQIHELEIDGKVINLEDAKLLAKTLYKKRISE